MGGHTGGPPLIRGISDLELVASGGQGGGGGSGGGGGDSSVRLWRVLTVHQPGGGSYLDLACERVLSGHSDALTDIVFLPSARLLVTTSLDCSIRCWDTDASPHPLTAPEVALRLEPNTASHATLVCTTPEVALRLEPSTACDPTPHSPAPTPLSRPPLTLASPTTT